MDDSNPAVPSEEEPVQPVITFKKKPRRNIRARNVEESGENEDGNTEDGELT